MKSLKSILPLFLAVSMLFTALEAAPHISVKALFKDKAMFYVDGQSRTLTVGQTSPEGITLIAADSFEATLEVAGKRLVYTLGKSFSNRAPPPTKTKNVRIAVDGQGMYRTMGFINGYSVNFLVDTGASIVAINSVEAERLGIDYKSGQPVSVSTASGIARAYGVHLDSVQVGEIIQRHVRATVILGSHPRYVLLGMTFLGQLDVHRTGGILELRKKE
ncbi:MAG: TIGR02281 family clan AA aspartic protease [Gammaproteobacteria bacterium]|nr:TIGR02281 family clan AA aspartic protease [Gammaproteobacteria bacterium]